jgi:hypothetical protein
VPSTRSIVSTSGASATVMVALAPSFEYVVEGASTSISGMVSPEVPFS